MKLKILSITLIKFLLVGPVFDVEKTVKKTINSQQMRKKDCNIQAKKKALMGQKRKSFMTSCLSNKSTKKGNSQNEKI
ncbi:MAG TPA: PsiF family protein [Arsenophonus sp.]